MLTPYPRSLRRSRRSRARCRSQMAARSECLSKPVSGEHFTAPLEAESIVWALNVLELYGDDQNAALALRARQFLLVIIFHFDLRG